MSGGRRDGERTERRRLVIDELRVAPGTPANLAGRDTSWSGGEEFEDVKRGIRILKDAHDSGVIELLKRGDDSGIDL